MGVSRCYWEEAYKDGSFLSRWDYIHPSQELVGAISALKLPAHCENLDLGCGAGRDAIWMALNGFRVTAIDLAPTAIEIAQQRAQEVRAEVTWLVGDVLELPLSDQSFDLITDRACFHHIQDSERSKYAREVSRVLKRGGAIIIRGSHCSRDDSFYEVSRKTISSHFPENEFLIGPVLPLKLNNNAGGLTANMVTLWKK